MTHEDLNPYDRYTEDPYFLVDQIADSAVNIEHVTQQTRDVLLDKSMADDPNWQKAYEYGIKRLEGYPALLAAFKQASDGEIDIKIQKYGDVNSTSDPEHADNPAISAGRLEILAVAGAYDKARSLEKQGQSYTDAVKRVAPEAVSRYRQAMRRVTARLG